MEVLKTHPFIIASLSANLYLSGKDVTILLSEHSHTTDIHRAIGKIKLFICKPTHKDNTAST